MLLKQVIYTSKRLFLPLLIMKKKFTRLLSPIYAGRLSRFATGMLLLVLMMVYKEVSAQTVIFYSDDFSTEKITAVNVTKGSITVAAGVLAVTDNENDVGYEGYAVTSEHVLFEPGFTYTISVDASMVGSSGKLEITKALTQAEAAKSTAARLLPISTDNVTTDTYSTITTGEFSVEFAQHLYIGLYAVSGADGAGMNLDNFVITKTACVPPVATIDPETSDTPRKLCMGTNGVTYFNLSGSFSEGSSPTWIVATMTSEIEEAHASTAGPNNAIVEVKGTGTVTVQLSATNCGVTKYDEVTLEVLALPEAPVTTAATRCGPGSVQVMASGAPEGGSYRWYESPTIETPIEGATEAVYETPNLTQPTKFYYVSTVNAAGCESSRTPVAVTINPLPEARIDIVNPGEDQCSNTDATKSVDFSLTGETTNAENATLKWEAIYSEDSEILHVDIDNETTTTPTVHVFGTGNVTVIFTVSIIGCTSATDEVILRASPTTEATGKITSSPENPVSGQPATFTVIESNIIENGDDNGYTWYISDDGGTTWTAPADNRNPTLTIASTPNDLQKVRVEIFPKPLGRSSCYSNLDATSGLYIITSDDIVLPVEIIYLDAHKQGSNVVLEWATAQEENNKGFYVEVSADGMSYTSLGFVETRNGNSSVKQQYTFTDRQGGKEGTRYYRLKQVDVDGTTTYFGPEAVTFGAVANRVQVYPNPFSSEINLDIDAEQEGTARLTVTNAIGKQLLQRKVSVQSGANTEKLLLDAHLPQGVYFIHVQIGSLSNYFKVLKQ